MTSPLSPEREAEIRARAEVRVECGLGPNDTDAVLAEVDRLRDAIESVHHQDTVKAIFCDEDCRDHEDECPVQDLVVCAGCARLADDVDPYYADRPVPEGVIWPCATTAALAAPTPEEGDRG